MEYQELEHVDTWEILLTKDAYFYTKISSHIPRTNVLSRRSVLQPTKLEVVEEADKCFICSINFYGSLGKIEKNYLECFEILQFS